MKMAVGAIRESPLRDGGYFQGTGVIFRVMTVVGVTQRSPFAGMTNGGITLAVFCEESRF